METIRTAVVGCGNISRVHFDALENLDCARVTAVCDSKPERAEKAANRFGCACFTDFSQMLASGGFDALHICTPHDLHPDMAIRAISAGKHVLTEKPMAIRYEDAERMCRAARERGVYLGVCFQNRYNPQSVFLKDAVDSGRYGALRSMRAFVTWKRDRAYFSDDWHGTLRHEGGGVVINQSIHTIDLMQWLAGARVSDLSASVSTKRFAGVIETEDTADALLTFDNGVTATFYATLCNGVNSPVYLDLIFDDARVTMDDVITVIRGADREVISFEKRKAAVDYWGSGHNRLISEFYGAIRAGKPFAIDGEAGKRAVEIVDRIYQYARNAKNA